MKWEIDCSWTVYYKLTVEGDSFEDALEKVCNKEIFTEYAGEPATFGLCESTMEANGIEAKVESCDGDPTATGEEYTQRRWAYRSVCGECAMELTYEEEESEYDECEDCRPEAKEAG